MQAIILAAGMGKRLKELTKDNTKCMVEVNEITLIERVLTQLDRLGLSKIVLVVGYMRDKLISFVDTLGIKTPIIYVDNPIYDKTNNIYSLYLAKEYLLNEDTLLLESDLIIEDGILEKLVNFHFKSSGNFYKIFCAWKSSHALKIVDILNRNTYFFSKRFLSKFSFSVEFYISRQSL